MLLNVAGAQPEKAKGLERALPREKLLLRHLITATRLLECDYAAAHRRHDRGFCGEPPTSGSSGMGARSWTGFGPLPANLYSVPGTTSLKDPNIRLRAAILRSRNHGKARVVGQRVMPFVRINAATAVSRLVIGAPLAKPPVQRETCRGGRAGGAGLLARQSPLGLEPPSSGYSEKGRHQVVQAAVAAIGKLLDPPQSYRVFVVRSRRSQQVLLGCRERDAP